MEKVSKREGKGRCGGHLGRRQKEVRSHSERKSGPSVTTGRKRKKRVSP